MKINFGSETDYINKNRVGHCAFYYENHAYGESTSLDYDPSQLELHTHVSQKEGLSSKRIDNPIFLVTMYKGIGDAVLVGLSFLDQIIKEYPQAFGKID